MVIVLVLAGYKRAVLGTAILSNGKGHFGLTDQTGQSGPPSKLVPNIPVRLNRNGPFHLMYLPKFLVNREPTSLLVEMVNNRSFARKPSWWRREMSAVPLAQAGQSKRLENRTISNSNQT